MGMGETEAAFLVIVPPVSPTGNCSHVWMLCEGDRPFSGRASVLGIDKEEEASLWLS